MIAKQIKGRGFRGVLDYLENKEDAARIGGNMGGSNARELAAEFKFSRQLNRKVERAVYHVSLSLPKHEHLDEDQWNDFAEAYLEGMKFDNNQYVIYKHNDRTHDHVHIVASRIRMDGTLVHDGWDYKRSEVILRKLEKEFNLQGVPLSSEKLKRTASTGQFRRLEREQQEFSQGLRATPPERTVKEKLQVVIDRTAVDRPSMPQFIEKLLLQGIEVQHGKTRNGKSKGIGYRMEGQKFSGTQLGAAYTFPGLQKHLGVSYSPLRDDKQIQQLLEKFKKSESGSTGETQQELTQEVSTITQQLAANIVYSIPQKQQLKRVRKNSSSEKESSRDKEQDSLKQNQGEQSDNQHLKQDVEQLSLQPQPIDPLQRERAEFIRPTAGRILKDGIDDGSISEVRPGVFVVEDKDYRLTYQKHTKTSTLNTLDGRGNLITVKDGSLYSAQNITQQDVTRWQAIEQGLNQSAAEAKSFQEEAKRQQLEAERSWQEAEVKKQQNRKDSGMGIGE